MCQKDRDHEMGDTFYRHICATCFTMGKEHRHMYRVSTKSTKTNRAVQKGVDSFCNKNVVKNYKPRTVYSNLTYNGSSYNWKADWARFVGKTYAKVVLSNVNKKHDLQGHKGIGSTVGIMVVLCEQTPEKLKTKSPQSAPQC